MNSFAVEVNEFDIGSLITEWEMIPTHYCVEPYVVGGIFSKGISSHR